MKALFNVSLFLVKHHFRVRDGVMVTVRVRVRVRVRACHFSD